MDTDIVPRIDVHMLTFNESKIWRDECLSSLKGAEIELHIVQGIHRRIGEARSIGFSKGTLPFVSWVDPDDIYDASAFGKLADALDSNPDAVMAYTCEALTDINGKNIDVKCEPYDFLKHQSSRSHVHGLIVIRRSALESVVKEILNVSIYSEWVLTLLVSKTGHVIMLPIIGRWWRQHPGQVHKNRDIEALELITNFKHS